MSIEEQIVETAFTQLALHTGILANWEYLPAVVDGEADFFLEEGKLHFYVEVKREIRQYQLAQLLDLAKQYQPFMIIAENIFPQIAQRLRSEKIAYLDTAGNIFINTNSTYLWIDGRKPVKKNKVITNRAFTKTGLKVVFYLLCDAEAINMSYRQLAESTNVALGNIQNVLDGLKETGFIIQKDKRHRLLHNKKTLLRRWIDGYRETLKPSLLIGRYRFWDKNAMHKWQVLSFPENVSAVWGGEPAASEMTRNLNPQEFTLYTNYKSALVPEWRLLPDEKGELHIYEQFWHAPHGQKGILAPPLLTYADLILTDDPRCIETAHIIYDNFLKDEFENN